MGVEGGEDFGAAAPQETVETRRSAAGSLFPLTGGMVSDREWDSGFRIQDSGFGIQDLGFETETGEGSDSGILSPRS